MHACLIDLVNKRFKLIAQISKIFYLCESLQSTTYVCTRMYALNCCIKKCFSQLNQFGEAILQCAQ